jgi:hypothetical protein
MRYCDKDANFAFSRSFQGRRKGHFQSITRPRSEAIVYFIMVAAVAAGGWSAPVSRAAYETK